MATDAGSSGDAGRARRLEHDAFGRIVVAENTVVITALPDTHATDAVADAGGPAAERCHERPESD